MTRNLLVTIVALQLDRTIHIGDLVNTVLGIIIALTGNGLRLMYKKISGFFDHVDGMDKRIEWSAEVTDLHTDVLVRAGWVPKDTRIPRVSKKRRKGDEEGHYAES